MSFFVSDSLKNIISEEDLAADSPIKIIEEKEFVKLQLCNDILNKTIFEAELVKAEFGTKLDSIVVIVDIKDLNIFEAIVNMIFHRFASVTCASGGLVIV